VVLDVVVVVEVVVVVVVDVVVVPLPDAGFGACFDSPLCLPLLFLWPFAHLPSVSPCARCAFTAGSPTVIVFLPLWQIVTFLVLVVVVPVVVPVVV
jgi:hypothetical protein